MHWLNLEKKVVLQLGKLITSLKQFEKVEDVNHWRARRISLPGHTKRLVDPTRVHSLKTGEKKLSSDPRKKTFSPQVSAVEGEGGKDIEP